MAARGVAKWSFAGEPVVQPVTHELNSSEGEGDHHEHRDCHVE
jgi:hypothetical protein